MYLSATARGPFSNFDIYHLLIFDMPVKRPSPTITDIDDSRSSTPLSDYRAFPQSDSPRQWEEEDEDDGEKLWEVEAVVNEEIDIFYRRSYVSFILRHLLS